MAQRDWHEWHAAYDNPDSGLARRLSWVQDRIRAALDAAPAGQVRAISLCAGQGRDLIGALAEYQKALEANSASSLANYRIGELLFAQRNYQASVNAYRDALRGDGEPRWTEVWSHIQLGKIFDITGQRDRAVTEYRLAVQTNDNTQGAVNEARQWLQKPYKLPDSE